MDVRMVACSGLKVNHESLCLTIGTTSEAWEGYFKARRWPALSASRARDGRDRSTRGGRLRLISGVLQRTLALALVFAVFATTNAMSLWGAQSTAYSASQVINVMRAAKDGGVTVSLQKPLSTLKMHSPHLSA